MSSAKELAAEARQVSRHAGHQAYGLSLCIRAIEALIAEAEADRGRLAALEERANPEPDEIPPRLGTCKAHVGHAPHIVSETCNDWRSLHGFGPGAMEQAAEEASLVEPTPAPPPSACREDCVGRCEGSTMVPHRQEVDPTPPTKPCRNWRCDGTGPAHRPAAAATAEPERTDTPSVPPSGSVAPAVPTTGRLVAVGTCYSHPTWGDHEHEAGCINWCWSVRYGMSAAPPAPVFALTEWEREHVRIGLAAGKGSLVGTLARLAVRALAALGVPLDGEGSR